MADFTVTAGSAYNAIGFTEMPYNVTVGGFTSYGGINVQDGNSINTPTAPGWYGMNFAQQFTFTDQGINGTGDSVVFEGGVFIPAAGHYTGSFTYVDQYFNSFDCPLCSTDTITGSGSVTVYVTQSDFPGYLQVNSERFTFTGVPEPTTLWLMALGLTAILFRRKK